MPTIDLGLVVTAVNNASAPLRQVSDDVKRVGDNAQATANRLKAIQVVIAGIVLEKTLELGKAFVEVAAKNQLAGIQLAAFTGGMKNAQSVMEHFNETIAASGVKNDDLASAMARLRSAGVSQGDAVKTIDNLVSGIVALGSKDVSGSLDNAVTMFQRFAAKAVVSTRELNGMVRSTGVTVPEMAQAMGLSLTQFYDKLKDKTTGAQALIDAFNKTAEQKFGGFVNLLGSTVGGALNQFKFHMDEAIGALGNNTGLDAHIALVINNIDKAVVEFIKTIGPKDIDNFFKMISDAGPIIADVASLVYKLAIAVVSLADFTAKFLAMLPPEATEFGVIGYVLAGKKGALIGAIFGSMDKGFRDFGSQVDQWMIDHKVAPTFFAADKAKLSDDSLTALGKTIGVINDASKGGSRKDNWLAKIIGTPEQMAALQAKLKELANFKPTLPGGLAAPPGNTSVEEALAKLRTETNNLLSSIGDKDALLKFQNAGDELGAKLQTIRNQTDGWNNQLKTAVTNIEASKLPASEQADFVQKIHDLQKAINDDTAVAIVQATKLNALKQANVALTQQQAQLAIQQTNITNARALNNINNGFQAFLNGTPGGQLQDTVDQQVLGYKQQIVQYQQQINNLQSEQLKDTANADVYQGTIDQLNNAISLTQQLESQTNVTTKMMSDYYQQLGETMNNDIANGITGLVEGTMTWADVGRQVFGDLTAMSIKFLLQLAEQQLFASIAQSTALATSAPIAAAMAALWGPAAMAASIATFGAADATGAIAYESAMASSLVPFADGGVPSLSSLSNSLVNGPTMFGLAGEAGTEAIMPLTRVGGKLGVRAEGGGGNHYHITVQAIDTQSGMDFIGKHIDHIDAGLNHSRNLNPRAGNF